jgi:catechol 2,3-dioxygenase-like lactoylglutathione lyase family enzyme
MRKNSFAVRGFGAALLLIIGVGCHAAEVDLTRFGPRQYAPDIVTPNVSRDAFFGVPGAARLVIHRGEGVAGAAADVSIELNGRRVWTSRGAGGDAREVEVPVTLVENNAIRVELSGHTGDSVTVRVRQRAKVDLGLAGRVHFNVNTNAYAWTREFYRRLGFVHAIGPFPETNTLVMSHSVGIRQPYRMYAELIYLGEGEIDPASLTTPTGRFIDIIEWKEPRNQQPAYARVNNLGIVKVTLSTTNLDADMASLQAIGTPFLAAPATRADGSRFVIARDPAGTLVELREEPGAVPRLVNGSHVSEIRHLTINVSDFERSRSFYRMLGFTAGTALPETDSAQVARAMGIDGPYRVRAEMMVHERDGSRIELVEWLEPRDLTPPHAPPINHPGIHRINYATQDLAGDVAGLKAQGVRFLAPIAPCCEGDQSRMGIALFADPDGSFLQVMGGIDPPAAARGRAPR